MICICHQGALSLSNGRLTTFLRRTRGHITDQMVLVHVQWPRRTWAAEGVNILKNTLWCVSAAQPWLHLPPESPTPPHFPGKRPNAFTRLQVSATRERPLHCEICKYCTNQRVVELQNATERLWPGACANRGVRGGGGALWVLSGGGVGGWSGGGWGWWWRSDSYHRRFLLPEEDLHMLTSASCTPTLWQ